MKEKIKNFFKNNYGYIIFLVLFYLILNFRLPYVIYAPGGAIKLDDRVKIEDEYSSEGSLNMAYVTTYRATPVTLLISVFNNNWDVINIEDYTYEDMTYEESFKRDQLELQEALDNATLSAIKLAGKDYEITKEYNRVIYITDEANTTLKLDDLIVSINDIKCDNFNEIKNYISQLNAGDEVNINIIRDDEEMSASATLYDLNGPIIGIATTSEYEYTTDPTVDIEFKSSEGGPSGGLMTSLEIYNNLIEEDLTKGRNIIGTGTIDIDGNVGEISGVKYKLAGAVKSKADIFICPMENLEEANKLKEDNNYDIIIIGVSTLSEAIERLSE